MLYALMMAASRRRQGFNPFRYTGPGPDQLIAGTVEAGYFGEVADKDLITTAALSQLVGMNSGTLTANNSTWLKFMHNRKTLFVPKLPARYAVSWDMLYEAGLVYGIDGPGPYVGSNGPVNQNKVIVIGGNAFVVRLMKGGDVNPATKPGGEFNDLMLKLWVSDPTGGNWDNQEAAALGLSGTGGLNWMQESPASNVNAVGGFRIFRSGQTQLTDVSASSVSSASGSFGWRPVLELIPNDLYTFAIEKVESLGGTPTLFAPAGLEGTGIETLVAMRTITPQADSPLIVGDIQGQPFESALAPRLVIGGANEPLVSIADIQGITV
jgi:hypothetical protein